MKRELSCRSPPLRARWLPLLMISRLTRACHLLRSFICLLCDRGRQFACTRGPGGNLCASPAVMIVEPSLATAAVLIRCDRSRGVELGTLQFESETPTRLRPNQSEHAPAPTLAFAFARGHKRTSWIFIKTAGVCRRRSQISALLLWPLQPPFETSRARLTREIILIDERRRAPASTKTKGQQLALTDKGRRASSGADGRGASQQRT